jgi:hypothetical protein
MKIADRCARCKLANDAENRVAGATILRGPNSLVRVTVRAAL